MRRYEVAIGPRSPLPTAYCKVKVADADRKMMTGGGPLPTSTHYVLIFLFTTLTQTWTSQ